LDTLVGTTYTILIMSPPILPNSSPSRPSDSRDRPALTSRALSRDELATKIEQQHAKIRALELAAEDRRRSDERRIQEQARRAESRKQDSCQQRLARTISTKDRVTLSHQQDKLRRKYREAQEEAGMLAIFRHKMTVTQDTEDRLQKRRALFDQQEEQRHKDRQARDDSAKQALLRYKTAAKAKKAQEAEERRLVKVKDREQKQAIHDQQDQQCRIERERQNEIEKQRRNEAAVQYLLYQNAIVESRRAQEAENYKLVEQ
jgi:hypothetical protein